MEPQSPFPQNQPQQAPLPPTQPFEGSDSAVRRGKLEAEYAANKRGVKSMALVILAILIILFLLVQLLMHSNAATGILAILLIVCMSIAGFWLLVTWLFMVIHGFRLRHKLRKHE